MLIQKKLEKNLMFQPKLLGDGLTPEKLNIILPKVVIEDILLKKRKKKLNEKKLYTVESQVKNKKENLTTKLNFSNQSIQIINLSPILEAELILKDMDLKPYWKESLREISEKSWCPTLTDLVDSGLNYSSGYLSCMVQHLNQLTPKKMIELPNKNSQKILCQSLQFSPRDIMGEEITINYCRKIRIYPNNEQIILFEKCFGAHRHFYNKTIDFIKKKYSNEKQSEIKWNRQYFRENNMTSDKNLEKGSWELEVPYDTREEAINDAVIAYKTNLRSSKNKRIGGFEMKYKSKKFPTQIFKVNKKALNINGEIFSRRLKSNKGIKMRKKMKTWWKKKIKKIEGNFIVKREGSGRYYLCLPMTRNFHRIKSAYNDVYLDPGVRTFQTFYSPDGIAGKLGDGYNVLLQRLGEKEDNLKGIITNTINKKTRRNLMQRCCKIRSKIKNKVNDLHWKSADYLCKNFDNIFLPTFETKNMSKKENRKIPNKTVRQMILLSHFSFKEKLKFKASCYGKTVIDCSEGYTTQTCGRCGILNTEIGGCKKFNCKHCNYSLDRDFHGARNIYLRTISKCQG